MNEIATVTIEITDKGAKIHFEGPEDSRATWIAQRMYRLLKIDMQTHAIEYEDSGERIEHERGRGNGQSRG